MLHCLCFRRKIERKVASALLDSLRFLSFVFMHIHYDFILVLSEKLNIVNITLPWISKRS